MAYKRTLLTSIMLCSGVLFALSLDPCVRSSAQDRQLIPQPPAPPPMMFVSNAERTQLDGIKDSKDRIKAGILLAETRLLRAEQFAADQRFNSVVSELGIYRALVEDTLRFIKSLNSDSNKTRDLYKRLELRLRAHATRLEAIRRVTPLEFAVHVRSIADFALEARTAVLNSFFSDTVLRENEDAGNSSSGKDNGKNSQGSPPEKKQ